MATQTTIKIEDVYSLGSDDLLAYYTVGHLDKEQFFQAARQVWLDQVGDLDGFEFTSDDVLYATWVKKPYPNAGDYDSAFFTAGADSEGAFEVTYLPLDYFELRKAE